jgi:integrase
MRFGHDSDCLPSRVRASEICGLEVKDVDMKNAEITILRLKGSLKQRNHWPIFKGSLFSLRSAYCAHG